MEVLEYVSANKIAQLIDLEGLIEQGNCGRDEIKRSDNSLSFQVYLNPYFTHFEIEENLDETFDLIFYLEGRNGLDIVDLETNIPQSCLKKIVEERIFGI
ncbi:MAG: hypothetical protein MUF58_18180 [Arcicella sp.]|jgi:hypothetical protein|nr:hypothetical protein [Arcicella sp.]